MTLPQQVANDGIARFQFNAVVVRVRIAKPNDASISASPDTILQTELFRSTLRKHIELREF